MSLSKEFFYRDLKPFSDFAEIVDESHFVDAPSSWHVIISDVRGSTKAIKEGRYKDVNLVGAASVTCVINALDSYDIPFVFGGDGSTVLVPDAKLPIVIEELKSLKALSEKDFGLELRVGIVSVARLCELGGTIRVGKYQLSPGNNTAQFRGSGLTLAEQMVKKGQPTGATLLDTDKGRTPSLEGLSCRLEPLGSKRGTILSILVKPKDENYLEEIFQQLKAILNNDFKSVSPVAAEKLKWNWFPKSLSAEVKTQKKESSAFLQWFSTLFRVMLSRMLISYEIPIGNFQPKRYKKELISNSDFKKFDETLRMVIDCTPEQDRAIEALLVKWQKEEKIVFGLHRSQHAIMTCVVRSASQNQHIHFIDGGDGGYALAAVQLKAQG